MNWLFTCQETNIHGLQGCLVILSENHITKTRNRASYLCQKLLNTFAPIPSHGWIRFLFLSKLPYPTVVGYGVLPYSFHLWVDSAHNSVWKPFSSPSNIPVDLRVTTHCIAQTRNVKLGLSGDWKIMLSPKFFHLRKLVMIWFLKTLVCLKVKWGDSTEMVAFHSIWGHVTQNIIPQNNTWTLNLCLLKFCLPTTV